MAKTLMLKSNNGVLESPRDTNTKNTPTSHKFIPLYNFTQWDLLSIKLGDFVLFLIRFPGMQQAKSHLSAAKAPHLQSLNTGGGRGGGLPDVPVQGHVVDCLS